jgi:hypothetical protein
MQIIFNVIFYKYFSWSITIKIIFIAFDETLIQENTQNCTPN